MVITTPQDRCLLCGFVLDVVELPAHRRIVHQVIAGERTVVDVPVGRSDWLRLTSSAAHHDHELVIASA